MSGSLGERSVELDARASGAAVAGHDRAWTRRVLPRVSRTFAVNIRVLQGSLGDAVRTAYLLCRVADTLEDAWSGSAEEIGARFDLLAASLDQDRAAAAALARDAARQPRQPDLDLVADLPALLAEFERLDVEDRIIIIEAVQTMIHGMRGYAMRAAERRDQEPVPYLDTEGELHDYCWVVAGCVGVMLTRLYGLRHSGDAPNVIARRLDLSPVVGEALQLTNILLDWPRDLRRGRCHIPASWLADQDLTLNTLIEPVDDRPRRVAERLETLARAALARVPDYLVLYPASSVRYRMFVLWPALWALASIRHARTDPAFPFTSHRPRLPRGEVRRIAVAASVAGHTRGGVRHLFDSTL